MHTVLITGGCGFIASHLVRHVFESSPELRVVNIDKMDVVANVDNVPENIRNSSRYRLVIGDICDHGLVDQIFKEEKFDSVFHLAAQSHVDKSYENPLETIMANVVGTSVIMYACHRHKVNRVLHMSTDEIYGDTQHCADEETVPNPTNPYSASKASAEHFVNMMRHSFNLPVVMVRSNNVYGPNQYKEKVLPTFVERLMNGKALELHDGGNQIRSWVHVDDACRAILLVFDRGVEGEVYNIDSPDEMKIIDIARMVEGITGISAGISHVNNRPFNDTRYWINGDKLRKMGWKPTISFKEGIEQTIRSFMKNHVK
jgi:dTDP-glucose 4,6-dehydratase